jgi:hypothetical protein
VFVAAISSLSRLAPTVVLVSGTQRAKSPIVRDHHTVHVLGNGRLPGIVLTQSVSRAPLTDGNLLSMRAMDALPRVPCEIGPDELGLSRSFEDFRHSDRTDPEPSGRISLEPSYGGTIAVCRNLVQQVDDER